MSRTLSAPQAWLSRHAPLFVVLGAFLGSRLFYLAVLGVGFDADPIRRYFQYLDPVLLKNDLLRSVFYLHSQPPAFNLYLGVTLKLSPHAYGIWFQAGYLFLGICLAMALHLTMCRLGVNRWLSSVLTSLLVFSPITVLYENWLLYTYPVSVFLMVSAFFMTRSLQSGRSRDFLLFFSASALVVLTRSPFHLFWFLLFLAALLFVRWGDRRRILGAAFFPLCLLVAVYAKNVVLFDSWTLGEVYADTAFATAVLNRLPREDLARLVREGKLSPAASIKPFSGLPAYEKLVPELASLDGWGVPALTQVRKSTDAGNLNHIAYLSVARMLLHDAITVTRSYPALYLHDLADNLRRYTIPASHVWQFTKPSSATLHLNFKRVEGIDWLYSRLVAGQFREQGIGVLFAIAFPWLILFGGIKSFDAFRRRDYVSALVVFYITFTVVMLSAGVILLSDDEHQRYRAEIGPFYLVLFGLFCQERFWGHRELGLARDSRRER